MWGMHISRLATIYSEDKSLESGQVDTALGPRLLSPPDKPWVLCYYDCGGDGGFQLVSGPVPDVIDNLKVLQGKPCGTAYMSLGAAVSLIGGEARMVHTELGTLRDMIHRQQPLTMKVIASGGGEWTSTITR